MADYPRFPPGAVPDREFFGMRQAIGQGSGLPRPEHHLHGSSLYDADHYNVRPWLGAPQPPRYHAEHPAHPQYAVPPPLYQDRHPNMHPEHRCCSLPSQHHCPHQSSRNDLLSQRHQAPHDREVHHSATASQNRFFEGPARTLEPCRFGYEQRHPQAPAMTMPPSQMNQWRGIHRAEHCGAQPPMQGPSVQGPPVPVTLMPQGTPIDHVGLDRTVKELQKSTKNQQRRLDDQQKLIDRQQLHNERVEGELRTLKENQEKLQEEWEKGDDMEQDHDDDTDEEDEDYTDVEGEDEVKMEEEDSNVEGEDGSCEEEGGVSVQAEDGISDENEKYQDDEHEVLEEREILDRLHEKESKEDTPEAILHGYKHNDRDSESATISTDSEEEFDMDIDSCEDTTGPGSERKVGQKPQ